MAQGTRLSSAPLYAAVLDMGVGPKLLGERAGLRGNKASRSPVHTPHSTPGSIVWVAPQGQPPWTLITFPLRQILGQRELRRGDPFPAPPPPTTSRKINVGPAGSQSSFQRSTCLGGRYLPLPNGMVVSPGLRAPPPCLLPPPSPPVSSPFLGSNLNLYCCSSRTSSPIPPDIRRRDPDPENTVRQAAPALHRSPTPRSQVCAQRGWRPGPRPSPVFMRDWGAWRRERPGPAWRAEWMWGRPGLARAHLSPSTSAARTPCLSHLCARIPGHRDSDAQLRGPKAPAAGSRGRGQTRGGVEAEPGVGRGPGRRGRPGRVPSRCCCLLSLPPPYTVYSQGLRTALPQLAPPPPRPAAPILPPGGSLPTSSAVNGL